MDGDRRNRPAMRSSAKETELEEQARELEALYEEFLGLQHHFNTRVLEGLRANWHRDPLMMARIDEMAENAHRDGYHLSVCVEDRRKELKDELRRLEERRDEEIGGRSSDIRKGG